MEDLLAQGLARLGLPQAGREIALLRSYTDQVARGNRRANLVRAEGDDLVVRHLLDCLAAARLIEGRAGGGPVADVGSGAGLPGIPLAIVAPHLRFVLIERAAARAAFLRGCVALLGLANAEVVEADVANLASAAFPLVVFRAFRPLARSLREVASVLAPGGVVAAYAGRREPLLAQIAELPPGFDLEDIITLRVPFLDAERHLVVFRSASPQRGLDSQPAGVDSP